MDHSLIVLLALLIDAAVGEPASVYRHIPHPIAWFGAWVDRLERRLNRGPALLRRSNGTGLTCALVGAALLVGWLVSTLLGWLPLGGLIEAVLASSLLAWRSLHEHVTQVAYGLRTSIAAGREAVAHIVGRDVSRLDSSAVASAAIESAAENFSDAVVAPVFWFLLLGLPGLVAYKVINTLDSMLGYRTERMREFGAFAARLDDWVNWGPARLSGGLFYVVSFLRPDTDPRNAWLTMQRDAPKHRSPNAGWPEAAVAGALGIALGGPRQYPGQDTAETTTMGNGRGILTQADITDAVKLMAYAYGVLIGLVVLFWWL